MKIAFSFGFLALAHALQTIRNDKKRILKAATPENPVEVFFKDERDGIIKCGHVESSEKRKLGLQTIYHCHANADETFKLNEFRLDRGPHCVSFEKTVDQIDLVFYILFRYEVTLPTRSLKDEYNPDCTAGDWNFCPVTPFIFSKYLQGPDVDVNEKGQQGFTLLHALSKCGRADLVEVLLKNENVDVNQVNDFHETPLHVAATQGKAAVVALLLANKNLKVNVQNQGYQTPLFKAANWRTEECVQLLLADPRVNVNQAQDFSGTTPLMMAITASNPKPSIVEKFLNCDRVDVLLANAKGDTALTLARKKGHFEMVDMLLQHPQYQENAKL